MDLWPRDQNLHILRNVPPHTFLRSSHDATVAQLLLHWSDMPKGSSPSPGQAGGREKQSYNTIKAGQCKAGPHNPTHTSTACVQTTQDMLSTAQAACTCESWVYCQSQPKPEHLPQEAIQICPLVPWRAGQQRLCLGFRV